MEGLHSKLCLQKLISKTIFYPELMVNTHKTFVQILKAGDWLNIILRRAAYLKGTAGLSICKIQVFCIVNYSAKAERRCVRTATKLYQNVIDDFYSPPFFVHLYLLYGNIPESAFWKHKIWIYT